MKSRLFLLLLPVFVTGFFHLSFAQTTTVDLTTPLATDPAVRIGKLDNGLTYYIRKNLKPEKRVEMRLAVNAGSILENDDQLGLAHFTEHMAFNGTKSFPRNELINFLQKTGVRFGADINAYTSFDETVYMLQLPTDDSLLVNKGLQVLEEWAHQITMDGKEIDKERGVIIEEWRMGLGAQDRMMKKFLPVILKGSRYAERLPIGKPEILENFRHETIRAFYRDWYRPDLQAVIIVGDIDPDLMEAKIKSLFAHLRNPEQERTREVYTLPGNEEPLIAITTDKEAMQNMFLMFYKHPFKVEKTLGDFRELILSELFTGMLNNRLSEISQKPESPWAGAGSGYGRFLTRTNDAYILNASCKESRIGESIEKLLEENERVRRFGFTQTEFDRQKEDLLSRYEKAAKEADKTESAALAGEYVGHFLSGEPIPGAQKKFRYLKNLLPGITLEDVNHLSKVLITDTNMAMVIMAPEKEGLKVPGTAEVVQIIGGIRDKELTAYIDNYREAPLVPEALQGASVVGRSENDAMGFTEYTLSNGVKVVLKPTGFKNDEILVSGFSWGGHSLYPDASYLTANFAAGIIDQSGAGAFDNVSLQKKLKGKNLQITPYIDDVKEGFNGNASPKDLETLLELVYLYFTGPRKDTSAFQAYISQMENQVKFMRNNPIMTFYDTLFKSAFPGEKRLVIFPTTEQVRSISLDEAFRIYTDRFSNGGDFTFFLVGNFQPDSIMPLILKNLGSLPSTGRVETYRELPLMFSKEKVDITVHKGADPQSMVGIVMGKEYEWNAQNNLEITMLRELLSIRLVDVIREKLSGVYSPQVMMQLEKYPVSFFYMGILFGCSPKTTGKLTKAVYAEVNKLRKHGPTPEDLTKVKESLIRARETDLEKNNFWLAKIESVYINQEDPSLLALHKERVSSVTAAQLQQAAARLLDPSKAIRVVLMPEKK